MGAELSGKRIVVTRASHQAESLCRGIRERGGVPIRFPTIAIEGVVDSDQQPAPAEFDWVVFTSANAVRFFFQSGGHLPFGRPRIAAVGSSTAQALQTRGMEASLVPDEFDAEHLLEALGEVSGMRFLLPQAEAARPVLAEGLREGGAEVEVRAVYRTVVGEPGQEARRQLSGGYDAVIFTSPSSVRGFHQLVTEMEHTPPELAVFCCIGPVTADAAEDIGYRVDAVASPRTVEGLIETLSEHFNQDVRQ